MKFFNSKYNLLQYININDTLSFNPLINCFRHQNSFHITANLYLIPLILIFLFSSSTYAANNGIAKIEKEDDDPLNISKEISASTTYNNLPANEIINTLYDDPLSEDFMGKGSSLLNKERNRSTSDLLSEFEGQAKEINDNTEVPDNIIDEHTKEERERIEAKADALLKEAEIRESKNNSGDNLLQNENKFNELNEKISNIVKEDEEDDEENSQSEISKATSEVLYKDNDTQINESKPSIDNAVIKETWPNTDKDPEFSKNTKNDESESNVEIIEVPDTNISDEIPDYEKMEGIFTEDYQGQKGSLEEKQTKSKKKKKSNKSNKKYYDKTEPLEPFLITDAKPKSIDDESEKDYAFTGILIPEKQPLSRSKNMLRWVLQLDDGRRIPLKSNLKLLQEVRKEQNLEDYVSIRGKMRTSSMDKNLRYLIPETIGRASKKSK